MNTYRNLSLHNLLELNDVLSDSSYLDLTECPVMYDDNSSSFTVGHLNIHSIPNKHEDLIDLLQIMREKNITPDLVLLCETFFNKNNHDKFIFPNYDIVSEYRNNKTRGGVSILVRSNLKYHVRTDLNIFDEAKFESVFVEIVRSKDTNIVVGEIYRVPGTSELDFLNRYEELINRIRNEKKKIIIGTDQNLDYLKINSHGNTRKFYELNLTNNLIPTILRPTRVTHTTATLIDNIYVDAELYSDITAHVIPTDISDHFFCLAKLQNIQIKNYTKAYATRKLNDAALRNIKGTLLNKNWSFLEDYDVNKASEILNKEILVAMDDFAPVKVISKNRFKRRDPWFSVGLRTSSVKCLKMYKKVLHLPHDDPEFVSYKNYRNMYKKLRRQAKCNYINHLIQTNRNDSKKLWMILNRLTGKTKSRTEISEEITINGVRETNPENISNGFAKYFSEIGLNMAEEIQRLGNIQDPMSNMRNRVDHNCFFFPTNNLEIERLIRNLQSKSSKGHDDITNNILKAIYPAIIDALRIIFNKSLANGEFPKNMKLAIVKPLYKGKCKLEISNYRPISLLPVLSKILEKIVNFRLVKFFDKYKIMYEGQYGFRKNRSTVDAILDVTGNIVDGFNKGMYTMGVFIDMSKAFDSIKHETLFKKLERYGIRGVALRWIKSYLNGRSIKVLFGTTMSKNYPIEYGAPQGSVLGPLIYSILANDMHRCLKFSTCVMFADDTTILMTGKNLTFLYRKMNSDLSRLSQWFKNNSLSLNIDKSNYILFKTKNKVSICNETIHMDGRQIKKVDSTKFLGVHIDEHLNWSVHVKHLLTKLSSGLYSLNMAKNILPIYSKKLLYFSHIQSHLIYGLSAWGPMISACDLKKLKVMQNKALRAIFNLNKRTRLVTYYKKGNIPMLESLIELSLLKISFRYVNNILPLRIVNLFEIPDHNYLTRNRNRLQTLHHTIQIYHKCFLARAPHLWLNLPEHIKDKNKIKSFVRNFFRYKFSELDS